VKTFLVWGPFDIKIDAIKCCRINAQPLDNNDETDRTVVVPELGPLLHELWFSFSLASIHWFIRSWSVQHLLKHTLAVYETRLSTLEAAI
jgi:hypothetical protein